MRALTQTPLPSSTLCRQPSTLQIDPGDYSRGLMRVAQEHLEAASLAQRRGLGAMRAWEEFARSALAAAHAKTRVPGVTARAERRDRAGGARSRIMHMGGP